MPRAAVARTRQQMIEESSMRRYGQPEEITKAVVFLSFGATNNSAGAELAVDGGGTQQRERAPLDSSAPSRW